MIYRRLGKAGVQVSVFSFGSWVTFGDQVDDKIAEQCMQAAYERGCNFFDNAEAYARGKSEEVMGRILAKVKWPRERYLVSSKVFFGAQTWGPERDEMRPTERGLSRKHVFEACHAALKRLQVDYLDLFFCHRADADTPMEETVRVMNDLIAQGKILYWGTSEWNAQQLQEAHAVADRLGLIGPTMEQPEYNLFHREKVEKEFLPLYAGPGLGTTIWSPLAAGILTGKYNDGIPEDSRAQKMKWIRSRVEGEDFEKKKQKIVQLGELAKELDTSLPRLALAWCAKNPNVSTVITGATKVWQVEENFKALDDLEKLTDEVMERIEGIVENKPQPPVKW